MRKQLFFVLIVLSTFTFWNCSSDSTTSSPEQIPSSNNEKIMDFVVTDTCYWLPGDIDIFIYSDGTVKNAQGEVIGQYNTETGTITNTEGEVYIENISLEVLEMLTPDIVERAKEEIENQNPNQEQTENSSSSIINPVITSSEAPIQSSSSVFVNTSPLSKMSVEGYPVASYKDISQNGTYGWNTRYWDACKPHCSWISNGEEGKTDTTTQESYEKGMTTARNCSINDIEVPTFTLGPDVQQYWMGYRGTSSACEVGAKGVFTCTDMAPVAVNDTLSYAYVAGPGSSTTCGKCFHLQYDGSFKDVSSSNAPKETHKALKGKHIIVMTSNIGHDVKDGQFDLMVPGGGVGIFNALSTQVNGGNIEWGAQYGGFLTYCQQQLGYDASLSAYQNCILKMCDDAFANSGFENLYRGCKWFAEWYMAADNPTYQWEEVECPQYLLDHYLTTINTTKSNNYRWHDDWSTYNGEELETQECLTVNYPQGCGP